LPISLIEMRGLTLLEILLVVGIVAILVSLTLPLGLDFYRSQQLETQSQGVIQALRRAQLKAISVESDSSFGVYLTDDNYTLFKGSSYLTRDADFDEVFDLPMIITVSGLQEIVFSKLEGKPNITGNIILSGDSDSRTININEMGRINYE